ncbi:AAA family ATPase [Amycolatopsis sp. RM579]|uniref:AAA family ATPase n=1 Tax=Amycolatopsis pithecellobii TaxID=664692 RepID=A0A6N7Z5K9_9PSEU|nr:AAA family ATPase [Amycolatopsis pithecellobii]
MELLGPIRAWRGPTELKLGPARQRAVLAVLAVRAGLTVSRADLISAVWGHSAPASVDGSIHTYVSGLRRALEPDRERWAASTVLVSSPAGYTLRIKPEDVDAVAFERLVAQARQQQPATLGALDEALGLWGGDPLSGVPGPFAEREHARLTELRLTALELRAEAVLALGEHHEIAAELTALAQEFPLRERIRELLMLAMYRSGQPTEALEVFRDTRTTLVDELGIEPGAALQRLHAQILAQDPSLDAPASESAFGGSAGPKKGVPDRLFVLPTSVSRRLASGVRSAFIGRAAELETLRGLVDDVCDGRGGTAWVEGDFGIGKSELLTNALFDVRGRGCQIGWALADELSTRIPLQVMSACLGVEKTPDLYEYRPTSNVWGEQDPALAAVGRMLALVDELCAQAPLILVIDDIQWADEASVLLWHRLVAATRQLPLLLIAAARPVPRSAQLVRLRQAIDDRSGAVLSLRPLSSAQALELHESLIGAQAGPDLRNLVDRTTGNPLYVTELTEALLRENAVVTTVGVADLADAGYTAPRSLVDTIRRHLDVLPAGVHEVLRWAALLGTQFTVTDIAAVAGKRPSELLTVFEQAVAANVIVDSDTHLAFRHPLLRQAYYDGIPAGARAGLHRQAAEALAGVGAPVSRVAEQIAAIHVTDPWVLQWLVDNHEAVSNRAPLIAADLLKHALETCPDTDPRREVLAAALVKVVFRLDQEPVKEAETALAISTDPCRKAEMRQLLAAIRYRRGEAEQAVDVLAGAVDDPAVPELWRRRHKHLLANFRRGGLDDLDAAESAGHKALNMAGGDDYLTAHALQTLWLVASVRRDHEAALEHIDKAIAVVDNTDKLADLKMDLLDNRVFTLQNLDRLDEAGESLRTARRIASEHSFVNTLQVPAAVHNYWTGNWNEALVELDSVTEDGPAITFFGLREPPATALLLHGVSALIAGQRGDTVRAAADLDAVNEYAPVTSSERENVDFLLFAQSLALTQRGDAESALRVLEPMLNPEFSPMMLRHQWLPWIVRTALDAGDRDRALRAVRICEAEAEKERVVARASVAAKWCRGMVERDAAQVLAAAAHYRQVGRIVELANAQEDAAALLAAQGDLAAAQTSFDEATDVYADLSARWNLERAQARLSRFGIRRRAMAAPPRSQQGWDSLSPVEVDIARLVATGYPNPAIAAQLGLPRRTVQAHVARLLAKLDTASRDLLGRGIGDVR